MYGLNHRYCPTCGHAVRAGALGCGTCRTPMASLMMYDAAYDRGLIYDGIGFDPMDGQFAIDIPGTDLAIEPDGQIDLDLGGIDIPLRDVY